MLKRFNAAIIIHECVQRLQQGYQSAYGYETLEQVRLITAIAHTTLGAIARTTAAYHDLEHTVLVTLTGQGILQGKLQKDGNVSSQDWIHTIVALLCHDIGYVGGICQSDRPQQALYSDGCGCLVSLPKTATDASLTPFHVDRGKQFIDEAFSHEPLIDLEILKNNLEMTRFPAPQDGLHADIDTYPGLVRAADLIGQLSDPHYLEKLPALFKELQEVGSADKMGYETSQDLQLAFPDFYYSVVVPYIQPAMDYLRQTKSGKAILLGLHLNVVAAEVDLELTAMTEDKFFSQKPQQGNLSQAFRSKAKKFPQACPRLFEGDLCFH
ncbi:metal-dependent phosphohydrolase [Phormidesmis sp. 146-35]